MLNRRIPLVILCLLLSLPAWTQQTAPDPDTPEDTGLNEAVEVDLVNLTLTAIDGKGRFVTNLRPDELTLKENQVPQKISILANSASENEQVPLTLAFLLDTSASMNESSKGVSKLDIAKNAATLVMKQLRADDKMILMTFNKKSSEVSGLTSDKIQLENAIQNLKIQYGRTALFDTINTALEKIKDEWGRKIMIICSDGQDNASDAHLDEVMLENLNSAEVTVLAVGIVGFTRSAYTWIGQQEELRRAKEELKRVASDTGGFAYFPSDLEEANDVNEKIRDIVRSQYSLAYKSTNPVMDGSWRKIEISCSRPKVKLVYRTGYYAK